MRIVAVAAGAAAVSMIGCARGTPSETPASTAQVDDDVVEEEVHGHGVVDFPTSCSDEAEALFEEGLGHLHHMMYEQAAPLFVEATEVDASCAIAHWGIAMTKFQPLWSPPSDDAVAEGKAALEAARAAGEVTDRESGYLTAAEAFFADPQDVEQAGGVFAARLKAWKAAQRELHEALPQDPDAAAFYALGEIAFAQSQFSPTQERDFSRELRAGELIERFLEAYPDHPGLFHYLIHAYDSPQLAENAAEVAALYDQLAPDVPHALHMPSHIFVRLGKWDETVEWNIRSAKAAKSQPINGMTSFHYPHALDYMMYGYLQLGNAEKASETLAAIRAIDNAQPVFAAAYGIAAPQARYYLEQGKWEEAAELELDAPGALPWENFPAAQALFAYARGLGAARSGDLDQAVAERQRIDGYVTALRESDDMYWASVTEALGKAVQAWIAYGRGNTGRALAMLEEAADLEDSVDKHPITPGEILPIRELYAEMLKLEGRTEQALEAYEASLRRTPNRRNAIAGVESVGGEVAASE